MRAPDVLILDLKTSGLYLNNMPLGSPQQPWAPFIGALQCDGDGNVVNVFASHIKADGRSIQNGALGKHGIDHRVANRIGIPESRALGILGDMLKVGPFETPIKVVTFGDMDKMVIASLFARFATSQSKPIDAYSKLWLTRPHITFIDLQKPYAQVACAIPSERDDEDFKWPTFAEASEKFLQRKPTDSADTLEDILLLKDLYFDFCKRGFIESSGSQV